MQFNLLENKITFPFLNFFTFPTLNSKFLDLDDFTIIDYFNGYEHAKKGIVKFVGNAEQRINEDYLRILRYFRFLARMTPENAQPYHDAETMDTIKSLRSGLDRISNERKWMELNKILAHPKHGDTVLDLMLRNCDLKNQICLEKLENQAVEDYLKKMSNIYKLQKSVFSTLHELNRFTNLHPLPALTFLYPLADKDQITKVARDLKMSNIERQTCELSWQYRELFQSEQIDFYQIQKLCFRLSRAIPNVKNKLIYTMIAVKSTEKPDLNIVKLIEDSNLDNWEVPKLPLDGNYLMENL